VKVLLDTHALLWWLFDDPKLPAAARDVITDPDNHILVSSASAWEIATKHRYGKLPEAGNVPDRLENYLRTARFDSLPITLPHALVAGRLPGPHKDPFDRILIAQSILEKAPVITDDPVFADYGASVIWKG
jgi:PIN domain nuclease of toxin-antitoxin system